MTLDAEQALASPVARSRPWSSTGAARAVRGGGSGVGCEKDERTAGGRQGSLYWSKNLYKHELKQRKNRERRKNKWRGTQAQK